MKISLQSTFTWYGRQKPKRFNYKGEAVSGSELNEVSPYSIVGLSATWDVNKNLSFTSGIDNLFDIRHYRAGNAQTTGNATTGLTFMVRVLRPITSRGEPSL